MGFALPAANAAKLVARGRPVVCITGDGGLLMAMHEMEVSRRLGLSVLVVLMDDRCLALIKEKQHQRGFPPYGMDFGAVDWPRVAEAFGWRGYRAESAASLEATLKEALGSREACLVDIAVDWEAYRPLL
jgi:thiamine pyrophosphate-dependent acetolactate synthase large subunit-like protein